VNDVNHFVSLFEAHQFHKVEQLDVNFIVPQYEKYHLQCSICPGSATNQMLSLSNRLRILPGSIFDNVLRFRRRHPVLADVGNIPPIPDEYLSHILALWFHLWEKNHVPQSRRTVRHHDESINPQPYPLTADGGGTSG
jgi:hypothetical protein